MKRNWYCKPLINKHASIVDCDGYGGYGLSAISCSSSMEISHRSHLAGQPEKVEPSDLTVNMPFTISLLPYQPQHRLSCSSTALLLPVPSAMDPQIPALHLLIFRSHPDST